MSDYSKTPLDQLLANLQKGYVGIHIQQGVPLLDRDLNLLQDLIAATVRSVITRYIGNGIPAGADGFAIQAQAGAQASQDFRILAGPGGQGTCLVGGVEVAITADTTYKAQVGLPALTTPTPAQPDPRIDIVYLDVFFVEVDSSADSDLTNSLDVGMPTSVRVKPVWVVRVAEGGPVPAAGPGHTFYPLAQLQRPRAKDTIEAPMITDLRQRRLTASDMEQRLTLLEKIVLLPVFVSQPLPQFIPRSGIISQTITLFGANFNVGAIQVRFDNTPAKIVGAPSANQVVVKVPPGLTPTGVPVGVKITVSNQGGADTSDDTFTVQPNPAFADPSGQFSPSHGTPGTQVTLNGFNFNVGSVKVQFVAGGLTVDANIVGNPTPNQIIVQAPSGLVPAGATGVDALIRVTTGAGNVTTDDTFHAEITTPAPAFVAAPAPQFLPRSGVGNQIVTLNGTNFNFAPVSVKFVEPVTNATTNAVINGAASATQIPIQVPPNLTAAGVSKAFKIQVTTAGGSVTSADSFNVTGP